MLKVCKCVVHTFFCDFVRVFVVRSVAVLEALPLFGLPLLKFIQLALHLALFCAVLSLPVNDC